ATSAKPPVIRASSFCCSAHEREILTMLIRVFSFLLIGLLSSLTSMSTRAQDWPAWRGPSGDSTYPAELPTTWSADSGIAWKAEIPAWGTSTPIVSGDAIFLTTQDEKDRLLLLKLDRASGKQL